MPIPPVSTPLQSPHRCPSAFRIKSQALQLAWGAPWWHPRAPSLPHLRCPAVGSR